jgi:hypothetical protein
MWRWKIDHPEFCKALEVGEAAAKARVGRAVFTRALGFTKKEKRVALAFGVPVEYEVEVYYPPEPGSAKLWLLNKDPENWREKREVQVYTPEGQAVRTYSPTREELVKSYDERIAKAAEASADSDPDAASDLGRDGQEVDRPGGNEEFVPLR